MPIMTVTDPDDPRLGDYRALTDVELRTRWEPPHGLFIGTSNPFGPRVAVKHDGRWGYVDNPRGGCEVYLGRKGQMA